MFSHKKDDPMPAAVPPDPIDDPQVRFVITVIDAVNAALKKCDVKKPNADALMEAIRPICKLIADRMPQPAAAAAVPKPPEQPSAPIQGMQKIVCPYCGENVDIAVPKADPQEAEPAKVKIVTIPVEVYVPKPDKDNMNMFDRLYERYRQHNEIWGTNREDVESMKIKKIKQVSIGDCQVTQKDKHRLAVSHGHVTKSYSAR